jgi:dihydroorotate dehydrogenase
MAHFAQINEHDIVINVIVSEKEDIDSYIQTIQKRKQTIANINIPSIIVNFQAKPYMDLLPLLSTDKYDWQQLQ